MKKIMFNDKYGLTEAVLNGRKTQTRRLVPNGTPIGNWVETEAHAHFKVGEVVAVAQSYNSIWQHVGYMTAEEANVTPGYRNKMFVKAELMPHHIRITNIRVERLQDISDEDCLAEGIYEALEAPWNDKVYGFVGGNFDFNTPRNAYAALIDKVSGKGTWDSNPYVFVYDFDLVD